MSKRTRADLHRSGAVYSDTTVTAGTTYSYTVSALDAAGNQSAQSTPTTATTPPPAGDTVVVVVAEPEPDGAVVVVVVVVACESEDACESDGVEEEADLVVVVAWPPASS